MLLKKVNLRSLSNQQGVSKPVGREAVRNRGEKQNQQIEAQNIIDCVHSWYFGK